MKVSVAIPCYEMGRKGAEYLEYSLKKIMEQTYPSIEVIVSDHSKDHEIELLCQKYKRLIDIKYIRYTEKRGSSSANHNSCIRNCTGEIIKFLCQDDYLYDETSIETIVKSFLPGVMWVVSSYIHTYDREAYVNRQDPIMNAEIHFKNSVGTHSCLAFRNVDPPLFDENLIWLMDCEYYRQLYNRFGAPVILNELTMVQYLWDGQVTNTSASAKALREKELIYVRNKYPKDIKGLPFIGNKLTWKQRLNNLLRHS